MGGPNIVLKDRQPWIPAETLGQKPSELAVELDGNNALGSLNQPFGQASESGADFKNESVVGQSRNAKNLLLEVPADEEMLSPLAGRANLEAAEDRLDCGRIENIHHNGETE
jgi:hypothetical protein